MINWLYPPAGEELSFQLMEKAAMMVVNKDKTYPKQQFSGYGAIAKAVYANRMFPFRYKRLFKARLGQILGGCISHTGIVLIYQGFSKHYTWAQITACKVTCTVNNSDPNTQSYYYDIYLSFGEEEGFNFNAGALNFFEFGGRSNMKMAYQKDQDDAKVGELFAFYYNRIRSERLGVFLSKGEKKVNLHHPINQEFFKEIQNRFHTPHGVFFKKKLSFKRLEFSPQQITIFKRKRKKIKARINWQDIANIQIALGAFYTVWIITYKEKIDYEYEFLWPNSWKLEPQVLENKYEEKKQQQLILPLCWLETI